MTPRTIGPSITLLTAATATALVLAAAHAGAPRAALAHHAPGHGGGGTSPTATPTGGGAPLDTGWVYYYGGNASGDRVIHRTSPDGAVSGLVAGAPGEYDPNGFGWSAVGVPSHERHDGDRWYLAHAADGADVVFPNVVGPYHTIALEIDAIREGDAVGTRLTDNAAACNWVWSWPAWAHSATGTPDAVVTWAGVQWADQDGDAAGDCETLVGAGIFRADLTYDAAGAVTGMSSPVLVMPVPIDAAYNVPNLQYFDEAPDGSSFAYSRTTGGLWVGAAGSAVGSHAQIVAGNIHHVTWSADQAPGTAGLQTTLAFTGTPSNSKRGTWRVQPNGSGRTLLAEAKQGKNGSQTSFIHTTPFWSPAGTHLAYGVWETGGPLGLNIVATVRRMAADGSGNVLLQADSPSMDIDRLLGWTAAD